MSLRELTVGRRSQNHKQAVPAPFTKNVIELTSRTSFGRLRILDLQPRVCVLPDIFQWVYVKFQWLAMIGCHQPDAASREFKFPHGLRIVYTPSDPTRLHGGCSLRTRGQTRRS